MTESSIEIGAMSNRGKLLALVAGPILGLLTYFLLPESYINSQGVETAFPYAGRACMGVTVWMAIWWFTEALPIAATAMIPLVVYPLLQITSAKAAMSNYASGTIFLFLGGFLLAAGIHRWHLDRRIALLTLRLFGTQPKQMVLGLMLATAGLSAWVSNTATAAMMVPIAIAVLGVVRSTQKSEVIGKDERNFGIAVLLSIAYAASMLPHFRSILNDGVAAACAKDGLPPNGIYVRFMEQTYGETVSFIDWLKIGLPVALLLLPATYFLLVNVLFPCKMEGIPGGKDWVRNELRKLGAMSRGEKIVLAVFVLAAVLWIFGPVIRGLEFDGAKPFAALKDETIAMAAGLLLFAIPVDSKRGIHALDWSSAKDVIAWDVLLLFGGGLTMAAALQSTGAAALVGAQATALGSLGEVSMMAGVATLVTFATEVTSNTALAATMMPLISASADALKIDASGLLVTTALAASCAFMMPVATPPNAIVFGTGRLKIGDMVKAGFWLNILGVVIITCVAAVIL